MKVTVRICAIQKMGFSFILTTPHHLPVTHTDVECSDPEDVDSPQSEHAPSPSTPPPHDPEAIPYPSLDATCEWLHENAACSDWGVLQPLTFEGMDHSFPIVLCQLEDVALHVPSLEILKVLTDLCQLLKEL